MMMMKDAGLEVRHVLMWVKNVATFSLGRLDYDYQHEQIVEAAKDYVFNEVGGFEKLAEWGLV